MFDAFYFFQPDYPGSQKGRVVLDREREGTWGEEVRGGEGEREAPAKWLSQKSLKQWMFSHLFASVFLHHYLWFSKCNPPDWPELIQVSKVFLGFNLSFPQFSFVIKTNYLLSKLIGGSKNFGIREIKLAHCKHSVRPLGHVLPRRVAVCTLC